MLAHEADFSACVGLMFLFVRFDGFMVRAWECKDRRLSGFGEAFFVLRLEMNQTERRIGDRILFRFEGVLRIYEGERVGLVGVNGAGKTTLLAVMAGYEAPDAGNVTRHGTTAWVKQMDDGMTNAGEQAPDVPDRYRYMSGGERTRWKWETAIRQRAAILFADEPTSHLDVKSSAAVQNELLAYPGTVVLVSHDRALLDAVCTRILELEDGTIKDYPGNYSDYRRQKELQTERAQFEYEQYDKERKRLERAAMAMADKARGMKELSPVLNSEFRYGKDYFGSKQAKVSKTSKAIQRRVEQLEVKPKPKTFERPAFDIQCHSPLYAKEAIGMDRVGRTIGPRPLFHPFSCSIAPGMRIGLVGPNGSGKTTLLNIIRARESGVRLAAGCKIGYFDQQLETLDPNRSVLEQAAESCAYPESHIRTILARMLMKRDDVLKPAGVLSGGEKVKAALAKLFLADFNVLLLDEPTNYLDIFARERLAQILTEYPGTLLFCSHDRYFIQETATHLLVIEDRKWSFEYGGYAEYEARKVKRHETVLSPIEREDEVLKVELAITELVGRLSTTGRAEEREELEARYEQLLERRRQLR